MIRHGTLLLLQLAHCRRLEELNRVHAPVLIVLREVAIEDVTRHGRHFEGGPMALEEARVDVDGA